MDTSILPLTLEDLRDPEKRAAYEEKTTVKACQKNLLSAIEETRESIESFKQISSNCNIEIVALREHEERDISLIIPDVQNEVERITDFLRNEMVAQTSENLRITKQIQTLNRESITLQQLTTEASLRLSKSENAMLIK